MYSFYRLSHFLQVLYTNCLYILYKLICMFVRKEEMVAEERVIDVATPLLTDSSWTTVDILCAVSCCLIHFGDAIELYLPGVITQAVSCELGITVTQEGVLGVAMYLPLACAVFVAGPLSEKFGRRPIMFFSLYTAIVFTVLCVVVHSYYTLLLSRALIGLTVGFNLSINMVIFAETASSSEINKAGSYLLSLTFSFGGVWVAVLGYLMLERFGWRVFLVSTSLPFFVVPIIILTFFLKSVGTNTPTCLDDPVGAVAPVPNIKTRVFKASLLQFTNIFQGYGTILLVPSLVRQANLERGPGDCHSNSVHGTQLLILAAVALANPAGRFLGGILSRWIKFRVLHSVVAGMISLCYGLIIVYHDIVTVTVAMTTGKLLYAITAGEMNILMNDPGFFGSACFAVGTGIVMGSGYVGSTIGLALAAFFEPLVSTVVTLLLSLLQIAVALSITEYK